TRGEGWQMDVAPVLHGLRVSAFEGARPILLLAEGAEARMAHTWHQRFDLPAEAAPSPDGEQAWRRRAHHEEAVLAAWTHAAPASREAPEWIRRVVLAADQFVA